MLNQPKQPRFISPAAATRVVFLISGLLLAVWAPLIPFVKARLALDDQQLGMLLLFGGLGAVTAMPLAGAATGRFGCRWTIVLTAGIAWCTVPVLAAASTVSLLRIALILFGAAAGMLDASMNIHAVLVERQNGRAMMSGFHGLWSVGGVVGAGAVSLMFSLGLSPFAAAVTMWAIALLMLAFIAPSLIATRADRGGPSFAIPHGKVILLGLFCLVLFLAEGAVTDWSAVFLTTLRGMRKEHAGAGFIAFATMMTLCRFIGDAIVGKFGPARVVLYGGLCAGAGLFLAILIPSTFAAVAGFGLVGLGAANAVPVMFSAAGRQTSMPANLALPAMTTIAYTGSLVGPAGVGFIANRFGLPAGLGTVGVLLMGVALLSTFTEFGETNVSSDAARIVPAA